MVVYTFVHDVLDTKLGISKIFVSLKRKETKDLKKTFKEKNVDSFVDIGKIYSHIPPNLGKILRGSFCGGGRWGVGWRGVKLHLFSKTV